MKIFIMVDMEGISGVYRKSQVWEGQPGFDAACRYVMWDLKACIDGCYNGGATTVIAREAHGAGPMFNWDDLDDRATYVRGESPVRMPGIESCDGLILLGYHGMAGTPGAVLEHTMSSGGWQNFWLNGKRSGEIAIDAG
ncbi:MAG: M55 family metallopeptidase, partial [Verrucomicrobia bacterium]|nr:M55 family metallopeptidase [Verrucomicrobiota bacterium]